jgi:predicted dehydrogenase
MKRGVMAGAGFFARFHAEAWPRVDGAEIVAVSDPDVGKARAFAREFGIAKVYTDTAGMLMAEKPDFLDVVTGPATHRALVEMAAANGVDVICQKPMAPEWDDCVAMVTRCEAAGVRLLIHENWRWQPWYREVRRLAEGGRLGRIFHVGFRMRTGDGRGERPYEVQPYFREMERLLIYETLVHFIDTFRFLAGELESVSCRTARVNPVIRGEDCALIEIDFASGVQGLIDANRISGPAPAPVAFGELRVEGDRGMVRMTPEGRLWLTEYGEAEREHQYERAEEGYKGDSVWAFQQHATDCLCTGGECESEGRAYLKTVAGVLACYRSAETDVRVRMGEMLP